MSSRFTMIVAVHLFLFDGERVLLARRYNTGYEDGKFSVPAGHVEEGESSVQAMVREAREEIGLTLDPGKLLLAHVMHRKTNRESLDLFFQYHLEAQTPQICEPDKCDLLTWSLIGDLPTNTILYIYQALECVSHGQMYSDLGF